MNKTEWKHKHWLARRWMHSARLRMVNAIDENTPWDAWRDARIAAGYFFECFPYLKESTR